MIAMNFEVINLFWKYRVNNYLCKEINVWISVNQDAAMFMGSVLKVLTLNNLAQTILNAPIWDKRQ